MSWAAIAKKDFRDARRAKILWGATGIFVFFYAIFLLTASQGGRPAEEAAVDAIEPLVFAGAFLLPLVLISMAYLAIAGERESGSIKYMLGLPNSRFDVVLGKFLGRSAVALSAVGIAVVAGAVMLLYQFGTIPGEYVTYVALTSLFALSFVSIAVGVSAFSASRGKAMAGSIGSYFVFGVLWIVPGVTPQDSVAYVVEDLLGMDAIPELYNFVEVLSPVWAYAAAVQGFIFAPPEGPESAEYHPAGSDTPLYLTDDFMVVILVAWVIVPLAIGYWRFNRAELG